MLSIWKRGITSGKKFLVNNHNTYGNCRKAAEKDIEQQPARKTNSRNRHRWHNKAKQPTHTGPTSKRGKTFAEPLEDWLKGPFHQPTHFDAWKPPGPDLTDHHFNFLENRSLRIKRQNTNATGLALAIWPAAPTRAAPTTQGRRRVFFFGSKSSFFSPCMSRISNNIVRVWSFSKSCVMRKTVKNTVAKGEPQIGV